MGYRMNTYTIIDDILVVSKGAGTEHWVDAKKALGKLDAMKIRLNLDKCSFAVKNAESLEFHPSQ